MHRTSRAAVGIAASGIIPSCSCARRKPDLEGIKEDAIRIVRVHHDSLIVPVLWVIAGAALAISKRTTLRALHESPACTAVSSSPGPYLAARCTAAAARPHCGAVDAVGAV